MKKYFVGNDEKSIVFGEEESEFYGINITVKVIYIIIILLLSMSVIIGKYYVDIDGIKGKVTIYTKFFPINSDGFIFCESSKRRLSEEEILKYRRNSNAEFGKVLQLSINEIYVRHGYIFEKGSENDRYYKKYRWYIETDKHIVRWNEFNNIEKENLRLLIRIQKRYGYR